MVKHRETPVPCLTTIFYFRVVKHRETADPESGVAGPRVSADTLARGGQGRGAMCGWTGPCPVGAWPSRGVVVSFDGSGGQRAPTRRHGERGTIRGNGQRGEAQRERHSERGTARQEPGRGRGKGGAGDREGDDAAAGQTHLINNAHKQTRERALHTHTARWMTRRRVSRSDAADE